MVDKIDDLKIGIKTSAITFGRFDIVGIMLCHLIFLTIMVGVGVAQKMGFLYYIGLGISLGLIIYQYSLIYDRNPAHCFKAFLHNNWVGGTIFFGIVLDYFTRTIL